MGSIITLDNFNSADELPPTQANFPSLQHFFNMDEAIGSATITDDIGNVVITPDTALTVDGEKATVLTTSTDLALTSGSWAAVGTKETLLMIVGTWTFAGTYELAIGSATGAGVRNRLFESAAVFDDGTSQAVNVDSLIDDRTDGVGYCFSDRTSATAGTTVGNADATGLGSLSGSGDGTAFAASWAAPSDLVSIDSFTNIYGIAIFHFDTIPADVRAAMMWMRNEWVNGNKTIYPPWKGKS